jgi:hypothetical protein
MINYRAIIIALNRSAYWNSLLKDNASVHLRYTSDYLPDSYVFLN